MRNIEDVINKIKIHVPEDQKDLLRGLDKCLETSKYQPPESRYPWDKTALVLQTNIAEPIEDWQKEVLKIWTDNPNLFVNDNH